MYKYYSKWYSVWSDVSHCSMDEKLTYISAVGIIYNIWVPIGFKTYRFALKMTIHVNHHSRFYNMIICRVLKKKCSRPLLHFTNNATDNIYFTYNMHTYDTHDPCPFELYCALGCHFIFKIGLPNFYLV